MSGIGGWAVPLGCSGLAGFTFGLSGLVLCHHLQAIGVGFFRVVLASLSGLQSAILVIPLGSVACCCSWALSVWRVWCLSCYAAVRCGGLFGFGAKCPLSYAQQASQRDCPPFRLAKSVFFTGKRLRYKQSRGQPLTVTLGIPFVLRQILQPHSEKLLLPFNLFF